MSKLSTPFLRLFRQKEHRFFIYMAAHTDYPLNAIVALLQKEYNVQPVEEGTRSFITLQVTTTIKILREIIASVPEEVIISYERKEPKRM